ncbi:phytoene desaturase family protein [Prescottella agglutinans]|uniref:Pyridine nucleotide-disulfide oxidoreductase domain-containing protein 2 n=1 Tax=Prescottella agglutinans TaxID=1644129 RepID=A0ABT6M669_9NOCA|nr:NAD(P)/FAD-dependent oxidoreductase [Prescottella agglutinans]MDH6279374.1 phytoene dehydrogenase-like protein [Prescottella agglutinans]
MHEVEIAVIGSGINGLVAAAELALAGRRVALVERNLVLGGFVASGEATVPGFVHDTYSSWHPLFVSGAAYGEIGAALHERGLEYANSEDVVTAAVGEDGRVVVAHRDVESTIADFEKATDRTAYRHMLATMQSRADVVFGALGSELGPASAVRLAARALRSLGRAGSMSLVRDGLTSGQAYVSEHFSGWEVDRLWSPWLLHAGLSPAAASGGLMVPVMAATMHGYGLPVVRGGAARFIDAFERLLADHGALVLRGNAVERIDVVDGRARRLRLADGETVEASEAVVACVAPRALYGELLPLEAVDRGLSDAAQRYRPGRAAMQIHVALSRPAPWRDERLAGVPVVHVGDGAAATALACAEAEAGLLPERPTVVVGQQHVLDSSRVPAGHGALWIQLQELPFRPIGDAARELDTSRGWTRELADAYARRVLARIARFAPGLESHVLGVEVISPVDLVRHNPNAVDGDPYCGSAELDQNLIWRPFAGAARHRTVVPGLWHIGAATHPGPGLGGGSGHLAAQQILGRRRAR